MVCRSPVWLLKTGNKPSWQTPSWVRWLWRCRMGPWASSCTSWLTHPSSSSSFRNATSSSWSRESCTEIFCQNSSMRFCFSWYCQLHIGDCSGRMPWWDHPLQPSKNAQPDVWPFLLAPNGCRDKGACGEMLPVHHLQGKTAEGPHGKYCSYPSPGASSHQLAREWKENILVVTDPFTWYAQTYTTKLQRASCCRTISLSITGCKKRSFWTKGETLRLS